MIKDYSMMEIMNNGDAIVYIPSSSKITLVNDSEEIGGSSIPVCNNGANSVVLNIFKIKYIIKVLEIFSSTFIM